MSLRDNLVYLLGSQRFLPTLVDTLGLGNGDAFALQFANEFPLELRKRTEHGEHEPRGWVRAAGKCKTVLHELDRDPAFVKFPDDPAQVLDVAREPIKAKDDQRVASRTYSSAAVN